MQRSSGRSAVSRNAFRAALAVAVLLAGLVAPGNASANLIPDMRIEVASLPGTITAGSQVVYRVTIIDEGAVAAGLLLDNHIKVVSTLSGGSFTDCLNPCVKNVPGPISPGASVSFDLIGVDNPALASNLVITSKIEDLDLANTDPTDDTASASTTVLGAGACTYQGQTVSGATTCRAGYFPPGEHAFGAHTLVVPFVDGDTTPGVIGELAEVGKNSDFCRTHECTYGIGVLENFFNQGGFEVKDKNNPLRTIINTPKSDPCRGVGSRPCSVLQYEIEPPGEWGTNEQEPDPVIPSCLEPGKIGADQKLCMDKREKTTSAGLRFEVLLLSEDPGMY